MSELRVPAAAGTDNMQQTKAERSGDFGDDLAMRAWKGAGNKDDCFYLSN